MTIVDPETSTQEEINTLRETILTLTREIEEKVDESDYTESLLDWLLNGAYPECDVAIIDIREGSPTEGQVIDDNEVKARYIKYKMDIRSSLEDELADIKMADPSI